MFPGMDIILLVPILFGQVIGAWMGAHFTAGRVKSVTLSRIFAVAFVALAVQRAWILMT
jgi:uncharacterized membrane protein YfcA